jgi:hypothetical protein
MERYVTAGRGATFEVGHSVRAVCVDWVDPASLH